MFQIPFPSVLVAAQSTFRAINVNVENAMALAEKNLQEATAASVTHCNFYFEVLEKLMPRPVSFASVGSTPMGSPFGLTHTWDWMAQPRRTVVMLEEADDDCVIDVPTRLIDTTGHYAAAGWDTDTLPTQS